MPVESNQFGRKKRKGASSHETPRPPVSKPGPPSQTARPQSQRVCISLSKIRLLLPIKSPSAWSLIQVLKKRYPQGIDT